VLRIVGIALHSRVNYEAAAWSRELFDAVDKDRGLSPDTVVNAVTEMLTILKHAGSIKKSRGEIGIKEAQAKKNRSGQINQTHSCINPVLTCRLLVAALGRSKFDLAEEVLIAFFCILCNRRRPQPDIGHLSRFLF